MNAIPRDYVYLLIGIAIGFLVGWLVGRLGSASTREISAPPALEPPASAPSGQGVNLVVNNKSVSLDTAQAAEVQALISQRRMVEAIKRLREITGLGLAEAKAVAEAMAKVGS